MSGLPEVRRADKLMPDQEVQAFLAEGYCGRLGTVGGDGLPYVTPLLYVVMDGEIWVHNAITSGHFDIKCDGQRIGSCNGRGVLSCAPVLIGDGDAITPCSPIQQYRAASAGVPKKLITGRASSGNGSHYSGGITTAFKPGGEYLQSERGGFFDLNAVTALASLAVG